MGDIGKEGMPFIVDLFFFFRIKMRQFDLILQFCLPCPVPEIYINECGCHEK